MEILQIVISWFFVDGQLTWLYFLIAGLGAVGAVAGILVAMAAGRLPNLDPPLAFFFSLVGISAAALWPGTLAIALFVAPFQVAAAIGRRKYDTCARCHRLIRKDELEKVNPTEQMCSRCARDEAAGAPRPNTSSSIR